MRALTRALVPSATRTFPSFGAPPGAVVLQRVDDLVLDPGALRVVLAQGGVDDPG